MFVALIVIASIGLVIQISQFAIYLYLIINKCKCNAYCKYCSKLRG